MTIYWRGRRHEVIEDQRRWFRTRCGQSIFHTDNNNTYVHDDDDITCQVCLRVKRAKEKQ